MMMIRPPMRQNTEKFKGRKRKWPKNNECFDYLLFKSLTQTSGTTTIQKYHFPLPQGIPNELFIWSYPTMLSSVLLCTLFLFYPFSGPSSGSTSAEGLQQKRRTMSPIIMIRMNPPMVLPNMINRNRSQSFLTVVDPTYHTVISPYLMPVTRYLPSSDRSSTKISAISFLEKMSSGYVFDVFKNMISLLAEKTSWFFTFKLIQFGYPYASVEKEQLTSYSEVTGLIRQAFKVLSLDVRQSQSAWGLKDTHFSKSQLSTNVLAKVFVPKLYRRRGMGAVVSVLMIAYSCPSLETDETEVYALAGNVVVGPPAMGAQVTELQMCRMGAEATSYPLMMYLELEEKNLRKKPLPVAVGQVPECKVAQVLGSSTLIAPLQTRMKIRLSTGCRLM